MNQRKTKRHCRARIARYLSCWCCGLRSWLLAWLRARGFDVDAIPHARNPLVFYLFLRSVSTLARSTAKQLMVKRALFYLGVGDEVAHPDTLPTAVGDFHVGYYQPINGRPVPRLNRMISRALIECRIYRKAGRYCCLGLSV